MKSSTADKTEGTAKLLKGKAKEAAGNLTANRNLQDEGQSDQIEGRLQKKVGEIKKVFDR
jgi:uncharacterized protein YjbJ (UPF0337 family)